MSLLGKDSVILFFTFIFFILVLILVTLKYRITFSEVGCGTTMNRKKKQNVANAHYGGLSYKFVAKWMA
jgi:hypothetical protein